ncbi:MAG TPA: hypothetical protein VLD37_02410 [Candidatus Bilamarchaeum sp.]|nr:hypothetical protein [Candidatus Bilamarchaeum sp.]
MALLLLGCTAQKTEVAPSAPEAKPPEMPAPPQVSTANLTVAREPSNVLMADTKFPEPPKFEFPDTNAAGKPVVYYFFSPHCEASIAIRPEIDRLEAKYSGMEWKEFDITTQNGTIAYVQFAEQHNLSTEKRLVPQVLVNGTIITDRFNINESLEGVLQKLGAS